MNHYAVIMAGGAGTRLWPLSRRGRPKQVLRLVGNQSLLRLSFERLRTLLPAERIVVIGAAQHRAACLADLPELPPDNYIGEPMARDTAAAVGLSAALLHRRDPQAVLGVFTADHVIEPVERFSAAVERGYATAQGDPHGLVTFGIRPAWPHTGYGYVQRGEAIGEGVFRVRRFTEKPDLETARAFVQGGEHAWNSGMFCWQAATILEALRAFLPATHKAVQAIAGDPSQMKARYEKLKRISIDFAVMEQATSAESPFAVYSVDMDVNWTDVGSWTALRTVQRADAADNVVTAANVVMLDAHNCTIVGEDDHLIAAVGVNDLVIVRSPDATLICHRTEAERIKELLAVVQQRSGERYL
ncbi:MAG: mannose-1-phosphate guanylyltransferase [Phycisphaerae bacterium]|nr:NTP transferase domain-containing protein [Phycisphaerae bacterium]NUQ44702.1 mannose-1-phosphate guanylyltransferase [Phycisphaerae bacterium]